MQIILELRVRQIVSFFGVDEYRLPKFIIRVYDHLELRPGVGVDGDVDFSQKWPPILTQTFRSGWTPHSQWSR